MVLNDTSFECEFINKIAGTQLSRNCFAEKCIISLFKNDSFNWFEPESFDSVDITLTPGEAFNLVVLRQSKSVYDRYFCQITTATKTIRGYTDFVSDNVILLHSSVLELPELKNKVFIRVVSEEKTEIQLMNWMLFPQCHQDERVWMADRSVFTWF